MFEADIHAKSVLTTSVFTGRRCWTGCGCDDLRCSWLYFTFSCWLIW